MHISWTLEAGQDCALIAERLFEQGGEDLLERMMNRLDMAIADMERPGSSSYRRGPVSGLWQFGVSGTDFVLVCQRHNGHSVVIAMFEAPAGALAA